MEVMAGATVAAIKSLGTTALTAVITSVAFAITVETSTATVSTTEDISGISGTAAIIGTILTIHADSHSCSGAVILTTADIDADAGRRSAVC